MLIAVLIRSHAFSFTIPAGAVVIAMAIIATTILAVTILAATIPATIVVAASMPATAIFYKFYSSGQQSPRNQRQRQNAFVVP